MATSDAELRRAITENLIASVSIPQIDLAVKAIASCLDDRAAVRALVEALPRCCHCDRPAIVAISRDWSSKVTGLCDMHAEETGGSWADIGHEPALRAILERMRGWDGDNA